MRFNPRRFNQLMFAVLMVVIVTTMLPWPETWAAPAEQLHLARTGALGEQAGWQAFFAREMENFGVYGAIMVIVADGGIVLEQGYGFADAASQTPMDPAATIVRAGSLAKTVTALAVLQLEERGMLNLDADVNDYLAAFEVPATFPEPVTARHLINMTGGFDTRWVGIRAHSRDELLPLGEYLARHMPPRVLPPGTIRRYNDHELALAGYLVEVISGMPYEEYVRQNIFEPLDMQDSSILLPDRQFVRAARGYPVGAGPDRAYPLSYYYLQDAPGAGFNSTARDLSHLMLAHLQDGRYQRGDESRAEVLSAAGLQAMHTTAFTYHPKLAGQVNSFDEHFYNGQRYLRKDGGAPGMNNSMLLLPEQGVGLYLFYNSDGYGLRRAWLDEALSRYLPSEVEIPASYQPVVQPVSSLLGYAGLYREISDSSSETTLVKIKALVDPDLTVKVQAGQDGSLSLWGRRYLPVEPDLFLGSGPNDYIYFSGETDGRAGYLHAARMAFRRLGWLETPAVQFGLAGLAVIIFLLSFAVTMIKVLQGKAHGYGLSGLISGLNLAFLAGLVVLLIPVATGGDIWQFSFAPSLPLRIVLVLPLIALALSAVLLASNLQLWWKGSHSRGLRLFNTLVLVGVAAWMAFLHTWNLIGWRF